MDVLFLDYGNFTTVSLDQIYHLPPQLLTTNIQVLGLVDFGTSIVAVDFSVSIVTVSPWLLLTLVRP